MQKILLVDDHFEARRLMTRLLTSTFPTAEMDEVDSIQSALRLIGDKPYDLAILDLSLPDGKGETLIGPLRGANPDCQIVIWSMHDRSTRLISVLAEGATGYLVKDQDEATLRNALERLPFGEPALSASVTRRLIEHVQTQAWEARSPEADGRRAAERSDGADSDQLTTRERQVLKLLGQGFNRPDIAGILDISNSTVATHSANIYAKLRVRSRLEAVNLARERGLI